MGTFRVNLSADSVKMIFELIAFRKHKLAEMTKATCQTAMGIKRPSANSLIFKQQILESNKSDYDLLEALRKVEEEVLKGVYVSDTDGSMVEHQQTPD